ncbi:MAG TPA: S8 family serine peptidase [Bdellovibrionota bacterium]|nr:S8 family serine peptidase [Bdellovibrionota bacterium]
MNIVRWILVFALSVGFIGTPALAQKISTFHLPPKPKAEKVHSLLRNFERKLERLGIQRSNAGERRASQYSNRLVRVDDAGFLQTYVGVDRFGALEKAHFKSIGAQVEIENLNLKQVQVKIPLGGLDAVSQLPFVRSIKPPAYAYVRAGSVTTEGDAILKADELRALGYSGAGVRVGVLSDGADNMSSAVATGDLPSGITVFGNCMSGGCNEGTAMLEIVHDLAPSAQLAVGEVNTSLDFIARLSDLENTFGADIIVDDVGFFGEPYFENGPVAQAVAGVVADGVLYASAAGNDADTHYQADLVDVSAFGGTAHDFGTAAGGTSDPTMNVQLPNNGTILVVLEWNDAFGASANDYDLFLLNNAESAALTSSEATQDGNDDPLEALIYTNSSGSTQTVKIVVAKYLALENKTLEFFVLGDGPIQEYGVRAGSIFGHAAVDGAVAVGAIDASDPGNDDIESYSSLGPADITFPSSVSRPKPDICGIDGVAVTGAGGFPSTFFGTSAAAPHIAGLGALLKTGSATAADIRQALNDSAVDLGPGGFDDTYGAGRADVLAAAELLNEPPNAVIDCPAADVCVTTGGMVNFTSTCSDPNSSTGATFLWNFGLGSGISDSTAKNPGFETFASDGAFTVSLVCTDAFAALDSSPATRTVTVSGACGAAPVCPAPTPTPAPTSTPTDTPTPEPTPTDTPTPDTGTTVDSGGGCQVPLGPEFFFALLAPIWVWIYRRRTESAEKEFLSIVHSEPAPGVGVPPQAEEPRLPASPYELTDRFLQPWVRKTEAPRKGWGWRKELEWGWEWESK